MKHFRHPPVAFWALVATGLALLLVIGLHVGANSPRALVVPEPRLADEHPVAMAVVERVGQISVVATPPASDLNSWAAETAEMASAQAERRSLAAGGEDPIALAYAAIADDANALAIVDPSDAPAVLALQGRIGINRDRLAAAAAGITVPGLPGAPTDLSNKAPATTPDITLTTESGDPQ